MLISALAAVAGARAQTPDTSVVADQIFSPRLRFIDARVSGMSGAGCALLGGIAASSRNPALPHAYHRYAEVPTASITLGYGRDSLFSGHILPAGVSFNMGEGGSAGVLYRYLRGEGRQKIQQANLNYSGRLFAQSMDQGAVDFGINLRYERVNWLNEFHPLEMVRSTCDTVRCRPFDTVAVLGRRNGKVDEHHLMFDLGFFQRDVADHVDFGLTLHNLLGHRWQTFRPGVQRRALKPDAVDSVSVLVRDTLYFVPKKKRKTWLGPQYKVLTVGIVFRSKTIGRKVDLLVPGDLGFVGLFDSDRKTRFTLRTGVEARFMEHYALRLGYGNAPAYLAARDLDNEDAGINAHIFTGGAGVSLYPFTADVFIGIYSWGLSLGLVL